jgi:hypothetical protein
MRATRAASLAGVAAVVAVVAACNAIIGLGEPSVSSGVALDASALEASAPEASALDSAIDDSTFEASALDSAIDAAAVDASALDAAPGDGEAADDDDGAPTDGGGRTDGSWPARCTSQDACAPGSVCDPLFGLCGPTCDPSSPSCPPATACWQQLPDAGDCVGADYMCLGSVTYPAPAVSWINFGLYVYDVSSGQSVPAPGLTVRACGKTDAACSNPVAAGTTDASGLVLLVLPSAGAGFDGYFDLTGPSAAGPAPIQEMLLWFSFPLTADRNVEMLVSTVSAAQAYWPATMDPSRAQLEIGATACYSTAAFGASLSVSAADSHTVMVYLGSSGTVAPDDGGFPTTSLYGNLSDIDVANVPGPSTTLTTWYQGARVGTMNVLLRPGVMVLAYLNPTP